MYVLDARLTTLSVACSYSYLVLPILLPSLLEYRPSPWISATSVLGPSTAGALSSNYLPTKIDYCLVSLSPGTVISPKTAILTTNNILTTPQPLVANTGTRS
jgi:hypothetical protein